MCIQTQFIQNNEKTIFTVAFHSDVRNFAEAEQKLKGQAPGTFLTFSANEQNFCSVVRENGTFLHNPFRWDVSGAWYNGAPIAYATEISLLDHLVEGQYPISLSQ